LAIHDPPEPLVAPAPTWWRVVRSFRFAFDGVVTIVRTQPNFWVHVVAGVAALALSLALRLSVSEIALVVVTIALVLVAEAINTAIEAVCDLVELRYDPLIKRAKDVSAAAVLMAAGASVVVALLLFAPRLLALLH
jgi:diacylglycerol kinase